MSPSRRLPSGVRVAIAAATAVVAFFGWPAPNASAFSILNHEMITRNALPPDQVDEVSMFQILVGPPPGGGAMGSDAFPTEEFRHIDNAKNPTEVCARGHQAWNTFSPVLLSGSQVSGNGLTNGPGARAAFGALLHSLQDFYAHSNWVEDNIAAGDLNRIAPSIFPTCNPASFPSNLHTGYFSLQYGIAGCPPGGPPPGFQECHSTLNKDSATEPEGSKAVPGTNMNMFDLAAQLATTASTSMYQQLRDLVASTNGQDAATCLFQSGQPQCGGSGSGPALPYSSAPAMPAIPGVPDVHELLAPAPSAATGPSAPAGPTASSSDGLQPPPS